MDRNENDFSSLILYPATLLNLCISSNGFFCGSLGFSVNKVMSCENNDNFTSSFLI